MKEVKTKKPPVNKYAEALKEFNEVFKPKVDYAKLVREEFNEWFTEMEERKGSEHELKELCDVLYVVYGYADKQGWTIEKNGKEVKELKDKIDEYTEKYPTINLPAVIITTAYCEFITSRDFMWLYRLAQGIYAYADLMNFPLQQAFTRVHKSNMSKLEDGKPVLREDGKVLKGKNYTTAELKDLIKETPKAMLKAGVRI